MNICFRFVVSCIRIVLSREPGGRTKECMFIFRGDQRLLKGVSYGFVGRTTYKTYKGDDIIVLGYIHKRQLTTYHLLINNCLFGVIVAGLLQGKHFRTYESNLLMYWWKSEPSSIMLSKYHPFSFIVFFSP